MKKTFSLVAVAVMAVLYAGNAANHVVAYDSCNPCSPSENILCGSYKPACKPKESLWDFGLWAEAGIYGNEYGQRNKYDHLSGGVDGGNAALLGNVMLSDFQMNQLWVYGQKKLRKRGFDIGGRVDFGFGTDMRYVQSAGLEYNYKWDYGDEWKTGDYYRALPQLYGEIGYNNVSLKVGKFISTFGYESIMAPERFFYSMCLAYQARPATQTGAIATWDVSDNFSVYGGWVNGRDGNNKKDLSFDNGSANAFLGGFDWTIAGRTKLGYSVMIGTVTGDYFHGPYVRDVNYFIQSFYADMKLTERFNYVFEWTMNNRSQGNYIANDGSKWRTGVCGINNEFFYKLNDRWTLGARVEWLHTYGWYLSPQTDVDDIFSLTLGLNWKPTRWLTVKPEIRYDVCDEGTPFNLTKHNFSGTPQDSQWSGGFSMVVKF